MNHRTTLHRTHVGEVSDTDWEVEVDVTYTIHPGSRGTRVDGARFVEPDDPPELDVLDVKDDDGNEYQLTDKEEERIEREIWEAQNG